MMSFKYWMLCIVLFAIILFLAMKSYDALTHPLKLMPDKEATKKSETRGESPAAPGVVTKAASAAPYNLIAEKNIFNPERKDFKATGPGSASNAVTRPQVILYGVTIAGNYQSALLVNPGRSLKKGERDSMTLKLGERIGEYKLTKVLSDRITLEAQGDSFEVLLYDGKAPKKREAGTPRPFVGRETVKGTKELAQEKSPPSQIPMPVTPPLDPSQIPSPIPTITQIPWPISTPPQIHSSPAVATPIGPPATATPVTSPPGTGQSVPPPAAAPAQSSSPGGR